MRILRYLSVEMPELLSIWPFRQPTTNSGIVEVFPRLYFKLANTLPSLWQNQENINQTLAFYKSEKLSEQIEINREDEADALVSAAALRFLSSDEELWSAPKIFEAAIKAEGWIFGVK